MPHDFPLVSKDLLDRLSEIWPASLPMLRRSGEERIANYDLRDIDFAAGSQAVIQRLTLEYKRQTGQEKK